MRFITNKNVLIPKKRKKKRTVACKFNLTVIFLFDTLDLPVTVTNESVIETTNTTGDVLETTTVPEAKGHSMDDIMPGTKPLPISVLFADVPQHTETELGSSVLLACRTVNPVAECQWSWQSLPPVHLPLPDIGESLPASIRKLDIIFCFCVAPTALLTVFAVLLELDSQIFDYFDLSYITF